MSMKAVFFDLDGTLLPMDQDEFVKAYFGWGRIFQNIRRVILKR